MPLPRAMVMMGADLFEAACVNIIPAREMQTCFSAACCSKEAPCLAMKTKSQDVKYHMSPEVDQMWVLKRVSPFLTKWT